MYSILPSFQTVCLNAHFACASPSSPVETNDGQCLINASPIIRDGDVVMCRVHLFPSQAMLHDSTLVVLFEWT